MRLLKGMMFAIISVILILTGCEKDKVVPIVEDVKVEQTEEKTALKDEQQSQEEPEETKEQVEPNKADEKKTIDSERTTSASEENKAIESKASGTGNSEEKQVEEPTKKTAEQNTNTNTNTSANKPNATPEKESTTTKSNGKQTEPVKEPNQAATTTQKSQPNVVKEPTTPKPNEKQPATVKEQTPSPQPKKEETKQTVTVSIVGEGTILSSTKVEISEGNTILDATLNILKQKGIPISVRGSGSGAYVEGINNLYEFDRGPQSGWEAKRNGAKIDRSAGAIKVGNGDTIQWIYTTDYKEDAN
ncbi:DUF4430 domain-containing protein [Metabacillus rhizolycopersici]|uniref:DUF4430 domain-containing protein n=1 Tax=Metabacillus rhizolycopersici TaxID=2875709 RepID=A0ABS7USN0_9BACI|nr:DUF4430 domain-containing protein [Metabacillus rhizolycopersici]MBZ5751092.1 DUF4430 domain-containing protein [Metabacillus rhizolycopersici]